MNHLALSAELVDFSARNSMLLCFFLLLSVLSVEATSNARPLTRSLPLSSGTCVDIARAISSASAVFYPGSLKYASDISHSIGSSSQNSACSVEPGTAEDVGVILRLLGNSRTPFAVKGGGHAYNVNFSSTTGIQISMTRFNQVVYDASTSSASVGSGMVWDDVYSALVPLGVNVVGGRLSGVGVAGLTLGGGYSFLSNQHGLALDNVLGFELVLPSGTVLNVTESSHPDLFFGLRGGHNNFGIVTRFTLKTYPQGMVWGGVAVYAATSVNQLIEAAANFSSVTDPKAELLFSFSWATGLLTVVVEAFYNAPTPPAGIFDHFLAIPALISEISTRDYTSMVTVIPSTPTARGGGGTLPNTKYSKEFLQAMLNETTFWGPQVTLADPTAQLTWAIEPFHPSVLSHGSASAYPATRKFPLFPTALTFSYVNPLANGIFQTVTQVSPAYLHEVAIRLGDALPFDGEDIVVYGNYAYADTPIDEIYGGNLARLRTIKRQWDPQNVMGLTGGWKIPL
ncbi:FAD-binding domain-containing protein [Punctularia strigosozonata HHB-11173 SS5]|uniref:FAD-binding domain-containing protein n=1 Tax=Punctularia strigosozonata (strain HHB-11173) TaxID=741275 RepID=UPI00044181EA|nr:FAD-binding domain-containing protein [Punctularia strigosozonata HHB-11173 SS5]EIN06221.1 FAD-binding domain-containing protein [Punctularia strigosozonata HHB-11173 SS5]